jgi:hypothetical protein
MVSLLSGQLKNTIKSKLEEFIVTDNTNIRFEKTKENGFSYIFAIHGIDNSDLIVKKDNPKIIEALKQFGGAVDVDKIVVRAVVIKLPAIKALRTKPIYIKVEKITVNIKINDSDITTESKAAQKTHVVAKRNALIASNHLKMMKELKEATTSKGEKNNGYFQKLLVDVLQNIVVEVTDINISVAATLPNGKHFKFGLCVNKKGASDDKVNGITIRNKDLSEDNTVRELIINNVCIYCTKADKKDGYDDNDQIKPKTKILQDLDIVLTVTNRGKELALKIDIDKDLKFILLSKQYLNLNYVATSLSNRLEHLDTLAHGKVAILDDEISLSSMSKDENKKQKERKRYIEYYKKLLLNKQQLVDKTIPTDSMVPKVTERDSQFEKDAKWARTNIYGLNKWAIADIQSIHALVVKMVAAEIRKRKADKEAKSIRNSISNGFNFMRKSFFGSSSSSNKRNDKNAKATSKSDKEVHELQQELDELHKQETMLATEEIYENIIDSKENLFIYFAIEKNLEFVLGSSKKKEKKIRKIIQFSLIDGVELNANKNSEHLRIALRVGVLAVEDLRDKKINILENIQTGNIQNDRNWNVFNQKDTLVDPCSKSRGRKVSQFTFKFQKNNKNLKQSIYARILVKSKLVADFDVLKDIKGAFAAPVGSQGLHGGKRLAHGVKTLGEKEAKSITPSEFLSNLKIDLELESPTIVLPKYLNAWENNGRDNLNSIIFTLGQLKILSEHDEPAITLHLISGSKDCNVLDIIGEESLTKLKVIDNFEGEIRIVSADDTGTNLNLKMKDSEIKILLDNTKIMTVLTIIDGMLFNQGTLGENELRHEERKDVEKAVKERIEPKPALLGSSMRRIIVSEKGYILSIDDVFVSGTYTNIFVPTNTEGYIFDLNHDQNLYGGKIRIKLDENVEVINDNIVNLVAVNANDYRASCSLHLSKATSENDNIITAKNYNTSINIELEIPNLILDINEYEEKSSFAVEVFSKDGESNKIIYNISPGKDKELNMNFHKVDIAIRDLTSKDLILSAGMDDIGLTLHQNSASKYISRDNHTICVLPKHLPSIAECSFQAKVVLLLQVPWKNDALFDTMKSLYHKQSIEENNEHENKEEEKKKDVGDELPPADLLQIKSKVEKYKNEMIEVVIGVDGNLSATLTRGDKENNHTFLHTLKTNLSLDEKGLHVKYSTINPEVAIAPGLHATVGIDRAFSGPPMLPLSRAVNFDSKTAVKLSAGRKEFGCYNLFVCEEDKAVILACQNELLRRVLPLQELGNKNKRLVERSHINEKKELREHIGNVEIDLLCKEPLGISLALVQMRLKDASAVDSTNIGVFKAENFHYHTQVTNTFNNAFPVQKNSMFVHIDVLNFETLLKNSSFNIQTDLALKKSIETEYLEDEKAVKAFTKTDMTVLSLPKLLISHTFFDDGNPKEERVLFPVSVMMELEDSDTKQQIESGKYNSLGKRIVKIYVDPLYILVNVNNIRAYGELNEKVKKVQDLLSKGKEGSIASKREIKADKKPTVPTFIKIVQLKGVSIVLQQDARVITSLKCDNAFTTGTLNMAKATKNMSIDTHVTGIELNAIIYNDVGGNPIVPRQSPIIENWSFSLFVEKFNVAKRMSGFSKGLRASCVSPQVLNLNVDPSVVYLLKELQLVLNKAFAIEKHDNNGFPIHQIRPSNTQNNNVTEQISTPLEDEERHFEKNVHRLGSTDKPQVYGEEHAGDEDLTSREQLILSLKSGTFDKLADFAGSLYEASQEDMDSVANAKANIQNKMAEQGDRILPSYSTLADGTVRVYTRNLINDPIQVKIQFSSEKGDVVGGDDVLLQPRKSAFVHDYTPDKVEVAAWINDQSLDINLKDQRIDSDPTISHSYHVSITNYINDKNGLEITISVYSVCLVINNMDYYIDVVEKEKNLGNLNPNDYAHIPDLPDDGYEVEFDGNNIPQNLKFIDHSKYGTDSKKKGGEVMEVQVRLFGTNANEDPNDTTTTGWSEPFSINTVGTEGQLDLRIGGDDNEEENENMRMEYKNIGINISSTEFTKLLSIAPRYLLLDKSSHRISVRQSRITDESWIPKNQFSWEQDDDWHSIQNGELQFKEIHFGKWKGHVLSSIQIQIRDENFESCWSNELHVHAIRPRRMHFRLCDESANHWVHLTMVIQFLGATTFIILEDAITNAVDNTKFESSLTVENKTSDFNFKFRQFHYVKHVVSGGKKIEEKPPKTNSSWFGKNTDKEEEGEDFVVLDDNIGLVVGVCPSLNSPLWTNENASTWTNIDAKSKNWLFYDYDNGSNNQFEIADSDGNIILSSLNIVKTGTTTSDDGEYLFEVSAKGSERVIRISSNKKQNASEDDIHEFDQDKVLTISLTGVGLSLLNNNFKNSCVEEVCYIHIRDVFAKLAVNKFQTITSILYCASVQIDNQTHDGNSVILSPAIPNKPDDEFLALPGIYDEFFAVAVGYFLKHVDLWKIKRSADEYVDNKVPEKMRAEKYEQELRKRLVKEFCLFILLEQPWASEPKSIKDAWEFFRKEIKATESINNISCMVPYEDILINQIDIHVESTTLFFFAFEKTSSQYHTIRHLELDTPYFDLEIHEEFIFSLLSSMQELLKPVQDLDGYTDTDISERLDKEEQTNDPNLKLNIIQEQYLTIQSSLTEAQTDDDHAEYFFEKIDLHPLEVRLTYMGSTPGSEKKLSLLNTKSRGLGAISSLPSIDSLVVIFASLHQTHAAYTLQQFSRLVGKFYIDQAMARLYKVVFKISVLDSPVRAVAGIGSGVSQLLQTPGRTLKALAKGDVSAAAKQIGGGICGLARAVVGGGAKVAGGAVGGVGFVFKKVTGVSAVTKTLFNPASKLFDFASGNLEGVYDNLVEDRLKSNRRNTRVRLPRMPNVVVSKYCYLDSLTLHLIRSIDNYTVRKSAKVGQLVPAVECIQKGKYVCSCYILYQKVFQHDRQKKIFIKKETEQSEELCLLVLSAWHLFCLEAESDKVNNSSLLWAIPFRRILDVNAMTVLANGSSKIVPRGESYLELVVTYATDDKDAPGGKYDANRAIFTRQRRIAATNRRHLFALYLLLRNLVFSKKANEM